MSLTTKAIWNRPMRRYCLSSAKFPLGLDSTTPIPNQTPWPMNCTNARCTCSAVMVADQMQLEDGVGLFVKVIRSELSQKLRQNLTLI